MYSIYSMYMNGSQHVHTEGNAIRDGHPQSNQSAGPVRFLIFCSVSISLLTSLVADMLVQISWECTPPYLSTGISNLLQPAQAEVVLGQRSTYLASWWAPEAIKRSSSSALNSYSQRISNLDFHFDIVVIPQHF